MPSLEELQRKYEEALEKAAMYRRQRDELKAARDRGEINQAEYKRQRDAVTALIRKWSDAARAYMEAINALAAGDDAKKKSDDASDDAKKKEDEARNDEIKDRDLLARAMELWEQADKYLAMRNSGQISGDRYVTEIDLINKELAALGFPPWRPPTPVEPEEPAEPVGELSLDIEPLVNLLAQQGSLKDLVFSSDVAKQVEGLVTDALESQGLTDNLALEVGDSPVNPAKSAELAKATTLAILGGVALAGSAVIIAEAGTLGQLETPARVLQMIFGATGADALAGQLALIPFQTGMVKGATRYWNSIHQAELPGPGDLIRFLVRETVSRGKFNEAMREQGFSEEWTDAYWTAHWREVARRDVMDAYHRGVIDAAERDKLLVILDFRPDARPGLSISDLDIVGSIGKSLIGRVDLRRSFRLGLLDFDEMVKRYGWLGYEDDSEQMAFIMANTAFEALQNACIRELGKRYAKGQINRADFQASIEYVRGVFDDKELWLLRYEQNRLYMLGSDRDEETSSEETTQESEELTEGQGSED